MTEPEFWTMIASTQRSDPEEHVERLEAKLAKLPVPEILSFGNHWHTLHNAAYSWPLWGAAYLINGGCSDDGFIDFRSWLLLKGEATFKAALADPDSLAEVKVEPDEASCECYPAVHAYEQAVGTDEPGTYYDALEAAHGKFPGSEDPSGENWDFDDQDEMANRLPKLFKKFGDA
jgi:hypothetical protein